jgi:hypothetical protein
MGGSDSQCCEDAPRVREAYISEVSVPWWATTTVCNVGSNPTYPMENKSKTNSSAPTKALTELNTVPITARRNGYERWVCVAVGSARPSEGRRRIAVCRAGVVRERPESGDLRGRKRRNGLTSFKWDCRD